MRRQPLIAIALAMIAGTLTSEFLNIPAFAAMLAAFVLLSSAYLFRNHVLSRTALICLCALMLGYSLATVRQHAIFDKELFAVPTYTRVRVVGTVASEPNVYERSASLILHLHAFDTGTVWQRAKGKLQIWISEPHTSFRRYQEVTAAGNLVWPVAQRNPGGFQQRRWLHRQGIQAVLRVRSDGWIAATGNHREPLLPIMAWVDAIHHAVGAGLDRLFSEEAANLLRGLLLGNRSEIDEEISENFVRSGVIHILAVSGLHVGFVIAFCFLLARIVRMPVRLRNVLSLCCIWIYAVITGLRPPVVRASVMASIFLIGNARDRPIRSGNLLAFAAIILLLFRPQEIFNAGFQLSFAAVAGILYFYPKIEAAMHKPDFMFRLFRYRPLRWLFQLFAVSLAAQLATLPFSAFHFGTFSFVGVFANLAIIPMVFVTVLSSFVSLLLLPISVALAKLMSVLPETLIFLAIKLTDVLAALPFASVANWYPPLWFVAIYIITLIFVFAGRNVSVRFYCLATILLILNMVVWHAGSTGSPKLKAIFFDIGQGDATLLQTPNGHAILIDAGLATQTYDTGKRVILPYLRYAGIDTIDAVFITHPHLDHYGGLATIAREIAVRRVFFADTSYRGERFRQQIDILQNLHVPVHIAERGQVIDDFAPVKIWIIGPSPLDASRQRDLNQASLAMQVRFGDIALLFMGDTERQGESKMLAFGDLVKSDILQVGHHGSKTSSSQAFLERVLPRYAVLSLGAFNHFGHPASEVTERLLQFGSDTLRTDLHGAFIFSTDGHSIRRLR